jgi:hypothetical protein
MSLIFRLSWRNLFRDRLRFIATIIGIVFSILFPGEIESLPPMVLCLIGREACL